MNIYQNWHVLLTVSILSFASFKKIQLPITLLMTETNAEIFKLNYSYRFQQSSITTNSALFSENADS